MSLSMIELTEVHKKLRGLFPRWLPTEEEQEAWTKALRDYPIDAVIAAIEAHHRATRFTKPTLKDVLSPLHRAVARPGPFQAQRIEQWREALEAEKQRIAADLAAFPPEELADYRDAILMHEPDRAWMRRLPLGNQFWQDLIHQRFVEGIAVYYVTTPAGRERRQMAREDYWLLLAQRASATPGPMAEALELAIKHGI